MQAFQSSLKHLKAVCFALGCTLLISAPSQAQETTNRAEVEKIVREYLLANPELLLEMQQSLELKQQEELAATQRQTIEENKQALYEGPFQIEFGNPEADITIVEFFDYNCGFCQRAMADMQHILSQDDNVRFILKEFPVLGEQSIEATRVSMAFSKLLPDKYDEFHIELLSQPGVKDLGSAMQVATSLGADETELANLLESPDIVEAIGEVYQLAEGLGITGTPSYLVGDRVVFGAVGYEELQREMAEQLN